MDKSSKLKWLPRERIYENQWYPWPVWALGWLCIIKASFWIFSSRGLHSEIPFPAIVPIKYILFMVILMVISQGIFNFKVWARNSLWVVCIVDLLFYLMIPEFVPAKENGVSAFILEFGSGPVSDIIAFYLLGISGKYFGRPENYREFASSDG